MAREKITADLAIIGGGSGGLVTAAGAAMLGRKVVLFEAGEMGGDCLNVGCVPSKAILTAAHAAHHIREADRMGIKAGEPEIDFPAVRAHVRQAIAAIEPNDSQERFEGLGVKVIREFARFEDARTIVSESYQVRAKRMVVATGTRPIAPPIEGLASLPYLTNETIWDLESVPKHLLVLGGGPIGTELGQAFRRLGARVTIIEARTALSGVEPDHAALAKDALRAEGIEILENTLAEKAETTPQGIALSLSGRRRLEGSHLLVAAGREPVVDGLDLERAGIAYDGRGIVTDDKLRTANKRVFAAGDIAGKGALTHLAGWHGSVLLRNFYFAAPTKQSSNPIPQAVYIDPTLARIGLTEAEAREQYGDKVKAIDWPFAENDRAIAEGDTRGGVKLVVGKGAKHLGVHVVGARADDLIQIAAVTLAKGGKVRDLTVPVAPYPTRGEILKRAAGKYYEPLVFGPLAKTLAGVLTRFH